MKNPWKKVMGHVRNSAKNGAAGGRTTTLLKRAGYSKNEITESINSANKIYYGEPRYAVKIFSRKK